MAQRNNGTHRYGVDQPEVVVRWDKNGNQIYDCPRCHDAHFIHPRNADLSPNYTRVIPCPDCKARKEKAKEEFSGQQPLI